MTRAILLIDMDAFYAAVEQTRRPELRGRPVVVGGSAEDRGVVTTASYEARACGVRTAMPTSRARRLCPQAVYLPVDMAAYKHAQGEVLVILGRYTDLVEPVSIDEAFLDVTGSRRLFGAPEEIARGMQRAIRDELGLSCSIGIGPTKLLAKLAAELEKPGGLTVLTRADVGGRLRALPVRALSGIGPATEKRLGALGVATIGELQDVSPAALERCFKQTSAARLKELALGGNDSPVNAGPAAPKSRGREVTFARDTADPGFLRATVLDLADRVAGDVRREGYVAGTVVLKIRDARFRTTSRQRSLPAPVDSTAIISKTTLALLDELHEPGRLLRLVGLSLTRLSPSGQTGLGDGAGLAADAQLGHGAGLGDGGGLGDGTMLGHGAGLGDGADDRRRDEAVDRVRARFGAQALRRGSAIPNEPEADRRPD